MGITISGGSSSLSPLSLPEQRLAKSPCRSCYPVSRLLLLLAPNNMQ